MPVPGARAPDNLNQPLNCFGIGDRGTTEFLDNHKELILYGKAAVAAQRSRITDPERRLPA
jgi:hypothetical protein